MQTDVDLGFLRIRGAANPLDASAVHPERYALVETMAKDLGVGVGELVGNAALAGQIELKRYVSAEVGLPTLKDIVEELKKPGRDPRAVFEKPAFRDDVEPRRSDSLLRAPRARISDPRSRDAPL